MRSFRSKPVGWVGESYRHFLARKGVRTRYPAYKGFSPDEVRRFESFFERNHRLKLKRDKSVKHIINKSDTTVRDKTPGAEHHAASFMHEAKMVNRGTGEIFEGPFVIVTGPGAEADLVHELEHGAQFAKAPKEFDESTEHNEKIRTLLRQQLPRIVPGPRYEAEYMANILGDFSQGPELLAREREEQFSYRHRLPPVPGVIPFSEGREMFSSANTSNKDLDNTVSALIEAGDTDRERWHRILRRSPKLRDVPDVWVKDDEVV